MIWVLDVRATTENDGFNAMCRSRRERIKSVCAVFSRCGRYVVTPTNTQHTAKSHTRHGVVISTYIHIRHIYIYMLRMRRVYVVRRRVVKRITISLYGLCVSVCVCVARASIWILREILNSDKSLYGLENESFYSAFDGKCVCVFGLCMWK